MASELKITAGRETSRLSASQQRQPSVPDHAAPGEQRAGGGQPAPHLVTGLSGCVPDGTPAAAPLLRERLQPLRTGGAAPHLHVMGRSRLTGEGTAAWPRTAGTLWNGRCMGPCAAACRRRDKRGGGNPGGSHVAEVHLWPQLRQSSGRTHDVLSEQRGDDEPVRKHEACATEAPHSRA